MSKQYVVVNSQSEFDEVQKILFSMGKQWIEKGKNLINLDYASQYIKVENGKYLYYGSFGACDYAVYLNGYTQISINQLRTMANQQQGLISGKEALRALADGKEVEWSDVDFNGWRNIDNDTTIGIFNDNYTFRLKPRTLTINIEIPAPFVPKEGETHWYISQTTQCGYRSSNQKKSFSNFGCWRTEEEVKQVVAALRGALCP